jgi:hypothetical protein
LILGRSIRSRGDELLAQIAAQIPDERLDSIVRHFHQQLTLGTAAEAEQSGRRYIVVINQHARAEAEPADASWLLREDAANRECCLSDRDLVADGHSQRRQELRPDDRAVPF